MVPQDEVIASSMERLFRREEPRRGAYLSRLFAFFSEEIVRHWAACDQAPFRDVGRPVVWDEAGTYHVLDFTLERKSDGVRFVTEMKCEIEYENYKYLTLRDATEIEHHVAGAAFQKLLRLAQDPKAHPVTIGGKEQDVAGSILVWGVLTPEGRQAAIERFGFADVLGVDDILQDLAEWQPKEWAQWVATRRRWSDELFDWLVYPLTDSDSGVDP